jgi:CubicO group peptidase (beta-lactamase class C family)
LEIHGYCDEKFAAVRDRFEKNFDEYPEIGACFAASVDGEMVIDLWAGHTTKERDQEWQQDTLVNVWSTTKTMTYLVALMLDDRGELSLEAPVSQYWPEFGVHGKDKITVAQILSHQAAVPGWTERTPVEALYDWDSTVSYLANSKPWWDLSKPTCGYHALSQGFLIGEVVRRVTGKTIGRWFADEVANKVNADFHIGISADQHSRIATIYNPPDPTALVAMMKGQTLAAPVFGYMPAAAKHASSKEWREAEIPAAGGQGNARSVVRAQTALANDGKAFGAELLSAKGAARASELQIAGIDLVLGNPVEYCMGYARSNQHMPHSPNPESFFWCGAGGSTIVIDPSERLCYSYVMNQMLPSIVGEGRGYKLGDAVYASI